jgi:hypothetical protein
MKNLLILSTAVALTVCSAQAQFGKTLAECRAHYNSFASIWDTLSPEGQEKQRANNQETECRNSYYATSITGSENGLFMIASLFNGKVYKMWYMATSESGPMTIASENEILKDNSIDGKITWSSAILDAAGTGSDAQVVIDGKVVCIAHGTWQDFEIKVLAH